MLLFPYKVAAPGQFKIASSISDRTLRQQRLPSALGPFHVHLHRLACQVDDRYNTRAIHRAHKGAHGLRLVVIQPDEVALRERGL